MGRNVQRFRKARRLTQEQLADRLLRNAGIGLRQQVLAKVELGTRPLRLSEAAAIARELEIPVDALIAGPTADVARVVVEEIEEIRQLCEHITDQGRRLLKAQAILDSILNDPNPFDEPAVFSEQLLYEATRAMTARPEPLPPPGPGGAFYGFDDSEKS